MNDFSMDTIQGGGKGMKEILSLVLTLVFGIALFVFGNEIQAQAAPSAGSNSKILVVYFSQPETDKPDKMTRDEDNSVVVINSKVLGNTQYFASVIQEKTGAGIYRIEPQKPYTTAHRALVEQARVEKEKNFRPVLKAKVKNLAQYDTIFLGYPNWFADMPMILYSFLEQHDLSGKTIIPFNTHGGSGFSSTIDTIAKLQPRATVQRSGLSISRDDVQGSETDIVAWLKTLKF